jgi:hypothetical protein
MLKLAALYRLIRKPMPTVRILKKQMTMEKVIQFCTAHKAAVTTGS